MELIDRNAVYEEMLFAMASTGYQSRALSVIESMPVIDPPPNDPLTLEELRGLRWEPVWVQRSNGVKRYYIAVSLKDGLDLYCGGCGYEGFADYGKTWMAYRRKPEEGTT